MVACCAMLVFLSAHTALALRQLMPDQIEKLRASGRLEEALKYHRAITNRTHPALVRRMMEKLAKAQGVALPPLTNADVTAQSKLGYFPTTGTQKMLVLLASFKDKAPVYSWAVHTNMFFGSGTPGDFPLDSVRNYHLRSSYTNLSLVGTVTPWYAFPNNRSTYTDNRAMIKEAATYWDSSMDYSQFDNDGDGYVDIVYFVYSGGYDSGFWWYYWSTISPFTLDGVQFQNYVWAAEDSSKPWYIWSVVHETGHVLGLDDYYDYANNVGPKGGVGCYDIMDYDVMDHCGFSKFMLDWIQPRYIVTNSYNVPLRTLGLYPDTTIVMPKLTNGSTAFTEYFMVENRQRVGNDVGYSGNWCIHSDGIMIWHVDAKWNGWFVYNNSYTGHKLLRLMEADGLEDIEALKWGCPGDYYNLNEVMSQYTRPDSRKYNGNTSTGGAPTWVKATVKSGNGVTMLVDFELDNTTPSIDITNDPPAMLNHHVDSYTLGGTNSIFVKGNVWWTNVNGASFGTVSRTGETWACTVTGLVEGANLIRVCATNAWKVQAYDTIAISRGYESDRPVLDPVAPGTVREHQVLLRQVTGRTNVAAVSCDAGEVIGTSCFNTTTWRFSCVPEFGTASQVWNVAFVGTNQYGAETQTLVVTVAPRAKKITPRKPLLFEDEDGDLLDIRYSGIKKGNSTLVFDGQTIGISNAYADGKLSFGIKRNKKTGGDGLFTLRDVVMDGDGKSVSLAGNVDNVTAPQRSLGSLKFTSKTGVASNVWLGWAKTISAVKGFIVGTVAVSNGFETLSAGTISGARILAGVAESADVTNTAATAGFKTVKAKTMNDSIVAGRDTMKGDKVVTPEIKVKRAATSTFFHTGTNDLVTPEPILP